MTSSAPPVVRRRLLPRSQEALSRAERSRFYKARARRHTEEALLEQRLQRLQAERTTAEQRLRRQTAELRQLALAQRDEAREIREADSSLLEAVMRKIQLSKRVSFEQAIKYKSKKERQELRQQQELQREASRTPPSPPPPPPPPPKLDLRLIWPGLNSRGHYRRLYARLLLAQPASPEEARRRGDECIRALLISRTEKLNSDNEASTVIGLKAPASSAVAEQIQQRFCWTR